MAGSHDPFDEWDCTFSIVACDRDRGEYGGAVATRRPAVGARIPFVRPGVGAIASQAISNAWLGVLALDLVARGVPPATALTGVLAMDPSPQQRQIHLVTLEGRTAAHTGAECPDWRGHWTGDGVSVAANHVVGPAVVDDMRRAFADTPGDLAERLVAALEAGEAAGGDARGKQSSAVRVYRGNEPFPWIDLRVDDHPEPVRELRRLLTLYRDERPLRDRPLSTYLRVEP